jgi:hypothetical protein
MARPGGYTLLPTMVFATPSRQPTPTDHAKAIYKSERWSTKSIQVQAVHSFEMEAMRSARPSIYQDWSDEHKSAYVKAWKQGKMKAVKLLSEDRNWPLPPRTTIRSWESKAKLTLIRGEEYYSVENVKPGPKPKLGEKLDDCVEQRCLNYLKRGGQVTTAVIAYVYN